MDPAALLPLVLNAAYMWAKLIVEVSEGLRLIIRGLQSLQEKGNASEESQKGTQNELCLPKASLRAPCSSLGSPSVYLSDKWTSHGLGFRTLCWSTAPCRESHSGTSALCLPLCQSVQRSWPRSQSDQSRAADSSRHTAKCVLRAEVGEARAKMLRNWRFEGRNTYRCKNKRQGRRSQSLLRSGVGSRKRKG